MQGFMHFYYEKLLVDRHQDLISLINPCYCCLVWRCEMYGRL